MAQLPRLAVYVFIGGGVVSWFVALRYFLIVQAEYQRALRQGYNLRKGHRGLPLVVIFMDLLPAVSKDRRKLVWSTGLFLGFCLAGALAIAVFGPRH
jgi:hypothetical protein